MKKIILLCLFTLLLGGIMVGCDNNNNTYYDDSDFKNPLGNVNVGGSNTLALVESASSITLENEKARIILDASNGRIIEYVNKESKVYLVKDNTDSLIIRIHKISGTLNRATSFSYQVLVNSSTTKKVELTFGFANNLRVVACVSLGANSDEVIFNLSLLNNARSDSVVSVEYPIIENIKTLYKPENDYYLSPVATGYLFNNPIKNFNNDSFDGVSRGDSIYPQGWNFPMQFSAYYSDRIGGFMWQTKDETGLEIKCFPFSGFGNNSLRLSIYHYLSDIGDGNTTFSYDTVFSNLVKGTWYEAADKYKEWAENEADFLNAGYAKNRPDINRDLYENTYLCIFGYQYWNSAWSDKAAIYQNIANKLDGQIFNIFIGGSKDYFDKIDAYHGTKIPFEFATLYNTHNIPAFFNNNAMMNYRGQKETFSYDTTTTYFECAYDQQWLNYILNKERTDIERYKSDGFYDDVGINAIHPLLCYDTTHPHGTVVNQVPAFLKQTRLTRDIAIEKGVFSVGQELISETFLPYQDFYQARSNGNLIGWMEHDRMRTVLENGSAVKVPLIEYLYHEYGALRFDGYLIPDELIGQAYYQIAAYNTLTGSINEYNYEYYVSSNLPTILIQSSKMINFINYLGNTRKEYKDFLAYGRMVPAPNIGTGKSTYEFVNKNYNRNGFLRGNVIVDDVVVSAFSAKGTISIFICNVTNTNINTKFVLNALRDYGVSSGSIKLINEAGTSALTSIKDGKANINLDLSPNKVVILQFTK